MKEIYYTYNNEAIGSCIILRVLSDLRAVDISRSCLILPFLLDDKTVKYFQAVNDINLTLENLLETKPNLFSSFNQRYLSLLPVTINSLLLLKNENFIKIDGKIITIQEELKNDVDVGERYDTIKRIVPLFSNILRKYNTTDLYRLLNIQL